MQCRTFPIGPLDTNCYLIYTDKEALVVDPGGPPAPVLDFLKKNNLSLRHILLTHLHFDHTFGVHELQKATGAEAFASGDDSFMLENELGLGGMWGLPKVTAYEFSPIEPGEHVFLGQNCQVLPTPGHTPGGLSFYLEAMQAVFAGDTLFYRSIGRTDFPGGNHDTLLHAIRTQLFALPDTCMVYPGHGEPSTIGDEKRNNPYVSDFSML